MLKKEHICEAVYRNYKLTEASITYKHNKNGMLITTPLDRISIQILNDYNVGTKQDSENIFPIDFDRSVEGFNVYQDGLYVGSTYATSFQVAGGGLGLFAVSFASGFIGGTTQVEHTPSVPVDFMVPTPLISIPFP